MVAGQADHGDPDRAARLNPLLLHMHNWNRTRTAIAGAIFLLCWGLGGCYLITQHLAASQAVAEHRATQIVEDAVQAVGQQVERTLAAISTLHALGQVISVAEGEQSKSIALVERHLREISADGRFAVLQVGLIDAAGVLEWSTVPNQAGLDLSDREHFLVHRNGRTAPFVSMPLIGRASGRISVQVTRPLLTEDGRFSGVVVVSVDPMALSVRLGDLPITSQGVVTLLRHDGIVLARTEEPARFIGQQAAPAHVDRLNASLASAPTSAASLMDKGIHGRELFVGVRPVSNWPLMILYSTERGPLLAATERLRNSLQLILAGSLALLLILMVAADAIVTREKANREAAQAESARREVVDILNALPGAAYRADLDGAGRLMRLELSAHTARLAGTRAEGPGNAEFNMPFPLERLTFLQKVLADGDAVTEYRVELAEGATRWLRDQGRLARRNDGGGANIVGILTDITAERALKAQALSTAKLATLGEMATSIAHELNQPCAAISLAADVASLELIQKGPTAAPRVLEVLNDIATQTSRLRDVLDHFRMFTQNDDGATEPISIEQAVTGALAIARGALLAARIRLKLDLPPRLPLVRGRLVSLEQVIVNLLVNARDAMERTATDQRIIHIRATQPGEDQPVRIALRDFGEGVTPEHLDRVFEPFFTTKPPGRGTGLGLSIAYATVTSFQGTIAIENCPDGGTEVSIHLQAAGPAPLADLPHSAVAGSSI